MSPIQASLRYPIVTLALTALVVSTGIYSFLHMPRTEDPSITIRTGLVLAAYPGATSEQVEKQVAKAIEEHIFKFPEVRKEKTYSTSRAGVCVVNVELEDSVRNADVFWAKLRHEMNLLSATGLPQGVRGPIVNSDFGETVALLIAIHGPRYGYRELRDYADRIKDELRGIRDVAKLSTYGEQSEQIWITSSLERLSQYMADPVRIIRAFQQRNIVQSSGDFDAATAKVPLRTTGLFDTEEQIRNVLVDVSRTGQPVYVRDLAGVERRYQDPSFLVRYDGNPALLLSVEMQKGKNIVEFGEKVSAALGRLGETLPPDLKLDLIADQPGVVAERIEGLTHEFLLAIGSVVLVTLILLPFRVALIAALAIPVTICATLGAMNAAGVHLHQVSIAGLIVVLGIVVDDAIVIADNYVELLDRGVDRAEAAWRCASDVLVPVMTATLTIISSFLPLLILSGSAGEFIAALPITVAVALGVSFVVAVFLTPILARTFIKQGLHTPAAEGAEAPKPRFNLLDQLQKAYNGAITRLMRRKWAAMALGAAGVVVGALLFGQVPEQFFPSAERNQFVIDVWMPRGSRLEATDAAMRRIEARLKAHAPVAHFAAFIGQSAPRFYYNVNPQHPDLGYGQFVVNTHEAGETPGLVATLRTELRAAVPEALVIVKELQQGAMVEAPVEIRISGEEIPRLQALAAEAEDLLRTVPFAQLVSNDYYGNTAMVDIDVDPELSNRLGLTNASVSQTLAGAFDGAPVSTFWEGDRPVTILLRLDPAHRAAFEDVRNSYITSQLTRASVPLRSIATMTAAWQPSRIVRRNGVRTITVRAFPAEGHYASVLLAAVRPKIEALRLPAGYRIEYGGELANRNETFPEMVTALGISVVAIFLVLLMQFRTVSEPLVVMSSIPLALLGAACGLVLTRNPFGFTAFMGLISLCGIVVRNAIILIDYIREKMAEGHSLEEAATEAGERRLRPIFLTTMAAAVGVTPMILSGSSLWSPLASVLAIGLVFSMFFTLLVVPVLYVMVESRSARRTGAGVATALLVLLAAVPAQAETRAVTLEEAVKMALSRNAALKIARARVAEQHFHQAAVKADRLPQLTNETALLGVANQQLVTIPAGALGSIPGLGPFPTETTKFNQGGQALTLAQTTLGQPLTQLFKIQQAVGVAAAETRTAEQELRKAEQEVALGVRQLYFGLVAAERRRAAASASIAAREAALAEQRDAVAAGNALEVAVLGGRAALLESRHALLTAEDRIADLGAELSNAIGLAPGITVAPAGELPAAGAALPEAEYLRLALGANPEIQAAEQTLVKARRAVTASRLEYIPDVSAFVQHTYQNGVPFLTHNNGTYGLRLTYTLFDWGKRRAVTGQRGAQAAQAAANLDRLRDRVAVDIGKAFRKMERARQMVEVAAEALALRRESERLSGNQVKAGVATAAQAAAARAATSQAAADELEARMGYEIARAEMARLASLPLP